MAEAALPWAICPDLRLQSGGGHLARCTALARALGAYGPVALVLEAEGIGRAPALEGGLEIIAADGIGDRRFAGAVLDDYRLDAAMVRSWHARVRGQIVQLLDFGAPAPGVDIVVNAAPGVAGERVAGVRALLGPSYAMLASAYAGRPSPTIREEVELIAIGMGLVDSAGATLRILRAIANTFAADCRVAVLLGAQCPNLDEVDALVRRRERWSLHINADAPWRILEHADLCISAAGQSLLERLALGLPTVALAVAENQRAALGGAAAAGAVLGLGMLADWTDARLAAAVTDLACDPARRAAMSAAAQTLVDGRGAARVAAFLDRYQAGDAVSRERAGALRS